MLVLVCALRTPAARAQAVGPEFRVNTYTTERQLVPRIAADSGGNFVVVWQSFTQDGSAYGVFGQRYGSTGAPLGTEFQVNSYTSSSQQAPAVASDPAGNFVVVWNGASSYGASFDGIFGQRYGSAGAPLGAEFRVNTYTPNYQRFPSVAKDSGGNFIVVWQSNLQDGSLFGIFGQRYGSAGAPLGAEFRVNTYTTDIQSFPSIAAHSGGSFVVVWQSFAQGGLISNVFGQRYASTGAPLGTEFQVNNTAPNYQELPSVAVSPDGTFLVVWQSFAQDGSISNVFGQRYASTGAPLGAEFRVNSYSTNNQSSPSVASDSDGNVVVVWNSNTQVSLFDVFGQRYAASGAPVGAEFLVNTYTPDDERFPSVATGSGGDFIVVWQSRIQDSPPLGGGGIYGQRFCPPLASVTISVVGATGACTTSTGGTATVMDAGGGTRAHQWCFRLAPGDIPFAIGGQTGASYLIDGADFPPGIYYLVCRTIPECGSLTFSNDIQIFIDNDITAPAVTPPPALTTAQTLCM